MSITTFIIIVSSLFVIFILCAYFGNRGFVIGAPKSVDIPPPPKRNNIPIPKLNFRAIIRWEQLRNKSFSLIDFGDKDDVEALLYTSCKVNTTFEIFRLTLDNKKFAGSMIRALELETKLIGQYQKKSDEDGKGSSELIGTIVSTLILSGVDAHYVLEEMSLCDLPLFIDAFERQKREQMENSRFWTYFNILPHIDGKKLKNGAKDLVEFPWEKEEQEKKVERNEEEDLKKFENFLEKGKGIWQQED